MKELKDINYEEFGVENGNCEFEEDFEDPLSIVEMIENLQQNRPEKPTKNYTKKLNYYKEKLSKYIK